MFLVEQIEKIHPKKWIILAHFNHCLRWTESDTDAEFVRTYADKKSIGYFEGKADIASIAEERKIGVEEAARQERYAFLERIRVETGAKYILTAHHLDDSIETLVLNLIRGTKLAGLSGIPEQNGNILRPFLNTSKSEILGSLREHKIPYRIDSTNTDTTFLRNQVRHDILPAFERINPEYRSNMANLISYMGELRTHVDRDIVEFLQHKECFKVGMFIEQSEFLQREIIRHIFSLRNQGTIGLSEGNIAEILRFIHTAEGGTVKEVKNLKLRKEKGVVYF